VEERRGRGGIGGREWKGKKRKGKNGEEGPKKVSNASLLLPLLHSPLAS